MDGDPSKNVKAFEKVVRAMHDADMGYFSINHPVDRDPRLRLYGSSSRTSARTATARKAPLAP